MGGLDEGWATNTYPFAHLHSTHSTARTMVRRPSLFPLASFPWIQRETTLDAECITKYLAYQAEDYTPPTGAQHTMVDGTCTTVPSAAHSADDGSVYRSCVECPQQRRRMVCRSGWLLSCNWREGRSCIPHSPQPHSQPTPAAKVSLSSLPALASTAIQSGLGGGFHHPAPL